MLPSVNYVNSEILYRIENINIIIFIILGHLRYKGRISRGGSKLPKKWPFLAFFQMFFCDKKFFIKDIQTKVLKHVKDW